MNSGDFSLNHFKVSHPYTSNNIVQMRSAGFQAPFFFGGSQVPHTLGIKGNSNTQPEPPKKSKAKKTK